MFKTRESIVVYLKRASAEISKQQGFRRTRLNPCCFDIVVYLKWASAAISKQLGFRSTRLNPCCFDRGKLGTLRLRLPRKRRGGHMDLTIDWGGTRCTWALAAAEEEGRTHGFDHRLRGNLVFLGIGCRRMGGADTWI